MNKAKLLCRHFAAGYERFLTLDADARVQVEQLTRIVNDEQSPIGDRKTAVAELERLLFPSGLKARPVAESFGERVDAAMRERGMNQRDLARALGMTKDAVYVTLARRCRKPWRRTVKRVADALGMTPTELWPAELAD